MQVETVGSWGFVANVAGTFQGDDQKESEAAEEKGVITATLA